MYIDCKYRVGMINSFQTNEVAPQFHDHRTPQAEFGNNDEKTLVHRHSRLEEV